MSKNEYNIKVSGPGIELEKVVSEAISSKVVILILTGSDKNFDLQKTDVNEASSQEINMVNDLRSETPELSIREFFNEKNPQRNPDKIVTVGVFLKKYFNQDAFTREDIVENFTKAAEPVPANLYRDIKWVIRAGWIATSPGKDDTYYVTRKGQSVVEKNFPKDEIEKTRQP